MLRSGFQLAVSPRIHLLILSGLLTTIVCAATVDPAHAQTAIEPTRLTFNTVEDRTGSGSVSHLCEGFSWAVWSQEQPSTGWRLMWSRASGQTEWAPAQPIEPGEHPDFDPRVMGDWDRLHVVFQRGVVDASEVMHGSFESDTWTIEPITINGTEDLRPDIAERVDDDLHVAWAGYDTDSETGKVFYARRPASGAPAPWSIERIDASELGSFWTGAAPRIDVTPGTGDSDIVHVTYRGGDFGSYRTHYARRENGVWTTTTLPSPNAEDLVTDVTVFGHGDWTLVTVAMSGSDCFGCFSRIYARQSDDGGLTFTPASLVSGVVSTELSGASSGGWYAINITGSQLSGNFYTGDLWIFRQLDGFGSFESGSIPPQTQSSSGPSAGEVDCIVRGGTSLIGAAIVFTDLLGDTPDSSEVFVLVSPQSGSVGEIEPVPFADGLRVSAAPNPFAHSTSISLDGADGPVHAQVYDVRGRLVRELPGGLEARADRARIEWDGRDSVGREVSAGSYWIQVVAGERRAVHRLVVVR